MPIKTVLPLPFFLKDPVEPTHLKKGASLKSTSTVHPHLCKGCGCISLPSLIEDRADQPEVERIGRKREYISGHDDFIYLSTYSLN